MAGTWACCGSRLATRPALEQVAERWPGLVPGLALTEGVGAVTVAGVVVGPHGIHHLGTGSVTGVDPLTPYGPCAAADLARLGTMEHCGNLVLPSTVDANGMVHAFEGQVGSHGGVGGLQNDGLLLHPIHLEVADGLLTDDAGGTVPRLTSAVAIHDRIERWRRAQGTLEAGP